MDFAYGGFSKAGGTYRIINKLNGRIYIGSAKCFQVRWLQHAKALEKGKHSNQFLLNDYRKCGSESFLFEVVEIVDGDREKRLAAEQKLLDAAFDKQMQCYNFRKDASSREGCSNTEESKKKQSEITKQLWLDPEYRKKIRHDGNKGKPNQRKGIQRSEETKRKISESKLNHSTSEATKEKLRQKALLRWQEDEKQKQAIRMKTAWEDEKFRSERLKTNTFVLAGLPKIG